MTTSGSALSCGRVWPQPPSQPRAHPASQPPSRPDSRPASWPASRPDGWPASHPASRCLPFFVSGYRKGETGVTRGKRTPDRGRREITQFVSPNVHFKCPDQVKEFLLFVSGPFICIRIQKRGSHTQSVPEHSWKVFWGISIFRRGQKGT